MPPLRLVALCAAAFSALSSALALPAPAPAPAPRGRRAASRRLAVTGGGALRWYDARLRAAPLATKAASSAAASGVGDALAQAIAPGAAGFDAARCASFAVVGAAYFAPILHAWSSIFAGVDDVRASSPPGSRRHRAREKIGTARSRRPRRGGSRAAGAGRPRSPRSSF